MPDAEPPSSDPASPDGASASAPPARAWWRRVLGAQESGLLLVILLMMGALTVFGGTKPMREAVALGQGDSFRATPLDSTDGRERYDVVITRSDGTEQVRTSTARPREGESGGARVVWITREVNAFLDLNNLALVAKDASFIAVMAVGMTAVIILGGIDLSVGSIYAVAAIVGAMLLQSMQGVEATSGGGDWTGWWANQPAVIVAPLGLLVCCAVGGLCGLANGAMIVGLRVHPFVITLGMMAALRGVTILIPKETLGEQSVSGFPPSFVGGFFRGEVLGVQPVPIVFMVVVGAIGWFVLSRTVFGRRTYAIGGNEIAARYAGVPVGTVKVLVYTIMGVLAGLAGAMYIGYYGAGETSAGNGYELRVIAATVIGGASLAGGRGTAVGAVLGAILVQLIESGMIILKIPQDYNQIVMGAAIIVAVVVDQAKSGLSRGRKH
ncbi:MAG: ABC transporter permease [Phycisphaerales bacterium]|nr:ABC transporter permease [Phycisphaerales bacterium]